MNVIQLWRIYRRAQKLAGFLEEAHVSKSVLTSTIFWTQVVSAALELSAVLPLPPGYAALAANVLTILLRVLRPNGPVHILPR